MIRHGTEAARRLVLALFGSGGRAIRYGVAGVTVTSVYVGLTLGLSEVMSIQIAIPLAYGLAIALHFTLQRWFVFADEAAYSLALHQQAGRYLAMCAVQYAVTALLTWLIPAALGIDERVAYITAVVIVSVAAFVFLRLAVFHSAVAPVEVCRKAPVRADE